MKNFIITAIAALLLISCTGTSRIYVADKGCPVYPDYRNVTIPATIAPLNFDYVGDAGKTTVTTFSAGNEKVTFKGTRIRWKTGRWRRILRQAEGKEINVSSSVAGDWKIFVSADSIDYALQYRLIAPGYIMFGDMSINERRLSDFRQRKIIDGTATESCVNCHEYNRGDPERFTMHIRGDHGCTLLGFDGETAACNTKTDSTSGNCVYPYWHPSGRYIAYSCNTTHQNFHTASDKILEVFDESSQIAVYDTKTGVLKPAPFSDTERYLDNYPVFSADGRKIYFCRAVNIKNYDSLRVRRYSLCSASFDPATGSVGNDVTTVIDSEECGYSIAFPRPSYDGKFIMYTSLDYGLFPAWHKESDLWLLRLADGERIRLDDVNSDDAESFHNFSSNSRWFVFGSRRDDGRFTHAYIAHIDSLGNTGRPFLLPQKDPARYYSREFFSYNTPCFVTGPFTRSRTRDNRLILSPKRTDFKTGPRQDI